LKSVRRPMKIRWHLIKLLLPLLLFAGALPFGLEFWRRQHYNPCASCANCRSFVHWYLRDYAEEHDGWFPRGGKTPLDSLAQCITEPSETHFFTSHALQKKAMQYWEKRRSLSEDVSCYRYNEGLRVDSPSNLIVMYYYKPTRWECNIHKMKYVGRPVMLGLLYWEFLSEEEFQQRQRETLDFVRIRKRKADGYRGIWYMNQPSGDEYVYKYSGGLGTYCAKHKPFAVYCDEVKKTFFCYGGTAEGSNRKLLHMVSYYDHRTGMVPRPTILLDKKTGDAHDNPVISVDDKGHIWIFSTSHGTARSSYIHRSRRPYDIDQFDLVPATKIETSKEVPMTNFSYMQPWHVAGKGFVCFFTRYNYPAKRTICFMTSSDGVKWSEWVRLATIDEGHYQISAQAGGKAGTAFNFHPRGKGLNWRTNVYYIETTDFGETWQTVDGEKLRVPLTEVNNPALVHDYQAEGLNVYLKDIRFDKKGRPVILYVTSKGYESRPKNDPRVWTTARWTRKAWEIREAMTSDNNYDMGSLYIEDDGTWRIIGPTETGPQPYNTGGEMAMWISKDLGRSWQKVKQLTKNSERNHTYARRPVNAHPDFYSLWADGHGRKPSESTLYFCDKDGNVRVLPREMKGDFARPALLERK